MTYPAADLVRATWSGSGTTSPITLGAAVSGFQGFPTALNGQLVGYSIHNQENTEKEAGFGIYSSSGPTLTRQFRTYPTYGGSAVNFSSSTDPKIVFLTKLASWDVPNIATVDPGVNDDITTGFAAPFSTWFNSVSKQFFRCTDHTDGAAVWLPELIPLLSQYEIMGRLAAGTGLATGLGPSEITTESTPASGDFLLGWLDSGELRKYDIGNLPSGTGDAAPSGVVSNATPFTLTDAARLHNNVIVRSHQASVDFEVAAAAGANSEWRLEVEHDGCTVSLVAGGSISPDPCRLINGGVAIIKVNSNAGSAPAVQVRGGVVAPATTVGGTKTYDTDDAHQKFRLTSTSTQTFSASANYSDGFECVLIRETAGSITVDGVDADYTISGPDVVIVLKSGTALLATGKAGCVILDAA